MYLEQEKIDKIIIEIYTELFKEATPSADFNNLMETGEARQQDFFMRYYLPQDEQDKITDRVLKKYNIKDRMTKEAFRTEITLGCSPNSSKNVWKKLIEVKEE